MSSVVATIETHVMGLDREPQDSWSVALPGQEITLRELVRRKVMQEVDDYNLGRRSVVGKEYLSVEELGAFTADGPARAPGRPSLDPDREVRRAWEAFAEGLYVVVVDTRQIEDLEALLTLRPQSKVQFLRLLPISGGSPTASSPPG